ncbi:hypothetical protein KIH39_20910 [Telmatocola sphagniphila]|uniref:DUF1573 domain-containing protein n=1 Tax=Telmatocola sphagniphila TaxID=1123043 RepID=A0A8E6EX56_9BACT|nr:hypothetical protein [Telmatocola sphagniphila]QVL31283.1 hypothetical protein KIH39_20910 [Telmatocola sphagniphila]
MPKRLATLLTAIAGTALILWFGIFRHASTPNSTSESQVAPQSPILMPELVEAGSVQNKHFIEVPVDLENRGESTATLDDFHSDCSCMKILKSEGELKKQFEKLELLPGEKARVYAQLRVQSDPGIRRTSAVYFRLVAEKPIFHRVYINYTPVAEIYCVPNRLGFGETLLDREMIQKLEVLSDGTADVPRGKITTSRPDTFQAAFTPSSESDRVKYTQKDGQILLGQLEIRFKTPKPGRFDDELVIYDDGKPYVRFGVVATSIPEFIFTPGSLLLPRSNLSSDPVYESRIICRSADGEKFKLDYIPSKSIPFRINWISGRGEANQVINVEYIGPKSAKINETFELEFAAIREGVRKQLAFKVIVHNDP